MTTRYTELLGRRQAVRQRVLIPSCGGSNPPGPAILKTVEKAQWLRPDEIDLQSPPGGFEPKEVR